MALDLTKVAAQVGGMLTRLKARREKREECLQSALEVLRNSTDDFAHLREKIIASKTTWLVAGLVDGLNRCYPAFPLPAEFTIIASDGSHIDVDRHRSARCYLINTGSVTLHYGSDPNAILESWPRLYAEDEDLVITPPNGKGREQPIEGSLLSIKRSVEECQRLAELAEELPTDSSALALFDGSLILWGLASKDCPEFVTDILLHKGFLTHLDQMRKLNRDRTCPKHDRRKLALASYISLPRSTDVINALRVAICPYEPVDCDHCPGDGERACDVMAGLQDHELFASVLGPGERSALFVSQSSVVKKHYGEHQVHFFYLRLDDEIARVEIPQWVAQDDDLLNLTHTLVLDQCKRGRGYPVALSEAHEQAVVTGIDREDFWQLVESLLVEKHLPTVSSGKSFSKRTRWV